MRIAAMVAAACIGISGTLPAFAECSQRDVLCAIDQETQGPEAAAKLAYYLGGKLPEGVEAMHLLEGGFQDRFIIARLETNDPGLRRFIKLLGLTDADFFAENEYETAGQMLDGASSKPNWWDWHITTDLRVANTGTQGIEYLSVGLASTPDVADRYVIYLWGFDT
jgi:hypothetical protein